MRLQTFSSANNSSLDRDLLGIEEYPNRFDLSSSSPPSSIDGVEGEGESIPDAVFVTNAALRAAAYKTTTTLAGVSNPNKSRKTVSVMDDGQVSRGFSDVELQRAVDTVCGRMGGEGREGDEGRGGVVVGLNPSQRAALTQAVNRPVSLVQGDIDIVDRGV